jgi:Arc/MetJ-type ribon-helix-helix transcriptional regulator
MEKKKVIRQQRKKNLTVTMAAPYVEGMTALIEDGLYVRQTEVVRDALRRLFMHYEIKMVAEEQNLG